MTQTPGIQALTATGGGLDGLIADATGSIKTADTFYKARLASDKLGEEAKGAGNGLKEALTALPPWAVHPPILDPLPIGPIVGGPVPVNPIGPIVGGPVPVNPIGGGPAPVNPSPLLGVVKAMETVGKATQGVEAADPVA